MLSQRVARFLHALFWLSPSRHAFYRNILPKLLSLALRLLFPSVAMKFVFKCEGRHQGASEHAHCNSRLKVILMYTLCACLSNLDGHPWKCLLNSALVQTTLRLVISILIVNVLKHLCNRLQIQRLITLKY